MIPIFLLLVRVTALCRLLPDTREEISAYFSAPYDARLIAGLLDALVFLLQQLLAQGYLVRLMLNVLSCFSWPGIGPVERPPVGASETRMCLVALLSFLLWTAM